MLLKKKTRKQNKKPLITYGFGSYLKNTSDLQNVDLGAASGSVEAGQPVAPLL